MQVEYLATRRLSAFLCGIRYGRVLLRSLESAVPARLPRRLVQMLALILVLPVFTLHAQEYRGTIAGRVTDSSGAVVPNAAITATGPQQTYRAKTGGNGTFTIPFVQPATYAVSVAAPGFREELRKGIIVDIDSSVNLEMALKVGATIDTVTVQANNEVMLDTLDASGGTVMEPDKVQNLPLNGRQVYMLLGLTPGAQFTQTQFGSQGYSGTRGWDESNAYRINGQSGSYNQFSLNGAPVSQQDGGGAGTWNIAPSVDAVAEFKVMTNTYDAQYGRFAGGTVNTILKSGTQQYHGTLFDFFRNSVMEANTYELNQVGTKKPFHNMHQFGGTLGGAVWKSKDNLFFFLSFEGWREVLPGGLTTTVPTPDMFPGVNGVNLTNYLAATNKNGIYDPLTTTCVKPSSNGCNQYGRQQYPNNTIPANRISPIGLKIMKLFPAPNLPGYINNYVYTGKNPYQYNQPIVRVDYNFSDATRMYAMLAWWSGTEFRDGNGFTGPAMRGNINSYRSSLTQVLDLTHTFNPNLVGDIRVSFNRSWNRNPDGALSAGISSFNATDLGLSMPAIPTTSHSYAPEINLGDHLPGIIGNTGDPIIFETYDLAPSVTHIVKQHNLHYGVEFMLFHDVPNGVGQPNGNFGFSSGFTQQDPKRYNSDGSVVADLLMGYPSGGSVQDQVAPYISYNYYAAYAQDNWRVTPKLALNLGLRWDTETSPVERQNRLVAGICLTCKNPITDSITYPSGNLLPNGASIANPMNGVVQFASSKLTAYTNTWGILQPKFGFSYAVQSKFVLRGGWGLGTVLGIELGGASPWKQSTGYNSSPDGGLTPAPDFINGNPYPNGFTPVQGTSLGAMTFVGDGLGLDQRDRKIPVVQQYSFGFESELPFQITTDVEYVGAHTIDLRDSLQMNGLSASDFQKGNAKPGYLDEQVKNPFYGVLPKTVGLGQNPTVQAKVLMVPYPEFNGNLYVYTHATGYSYYNSLITKAEKRFTDGGVLSRGLSFLGAFTWSKLMAATGYLNNSGEGLVDTKPFYFLDGGNRYWVLAFSGLYGIPIGRGGLLASNAHGLAGAALNNWQIEWIFQNQAGTPVGYPNGDLYNCSKYNIRSAYKTYSSYINNSQPSCWATFPEYTAKTVGGNSTRVLQPWAQQTQLGVEKVFTMTERWKLQFKAEAFNLTNTPIFGGVNSGNPEKAPSRNTSVADPNQPGAWSGFGTIGSTEQNFPRQIQLSLKAIF